MKTIIIQGSSNPTGNTNTITKALSSRLNADILDITTLKVSPFDYKFENQDDDFNKTIHNILDNYDTLIFATPVYWYTMSGIMKNFVDRFTDGLIHDKTLGVKFENKKMAAIACGSSQEYIEGFFIPFQKTSTYLKMNYLGNSHVWIDTDAENPISKQANQRLESFIKLF